MTARQKIKWLLSQLSDAECENTLALMDVLLDRYGASKIPSRSSAATDEDRRRTEYFLDPDGDGDPLDD